jgi:hypothetical protein
MEPYGAGTGPANALPRSRRFPFLPLAGDRVAEGTARFEVTRGSRANETWIVVARFRFDPSRWSVLPTGPGWTVASCDHGPVALARLGIVDPTATRLWWAVLWTDARSGAMHASEVRELTVVPRFANRVGADGALLPHASGRLEPAPIPSLRHTIELAAGYSLSPNDQTLRLPHRGGREARPRAPHTWFNSRTTLRIRRVPASRVPAERSRGRSRAMRIWSA